MFLLINLNANANFPTKNDDLFSTSPLTSSPFKSSRSYTDAELRNESIISLLVASIVSILFPASMYVWNDSIKLGRDHPISIRRNCLSISIVCLISLEILFLFRSITETLDNSQGQFSSLIALLNYRSYSNYLDYFLRCLLVPIFLWLVLFCGPICFENSKILIKLKNFKLISILQRFRFSFKTNTLISIVKFENYQFLNFFRQYIFAPLSEELLFRGVLLALLVPFWSKTSAIFISSSSLMHIHTFIVTSFLRKKINLNESFVVTIQCLYTFLFGLIASVNYLWSGNLITPILLHFLCNLIGLPEFDKIFHQEARNFQHHQRNEICSNRPAYRRGKRETAVKVFTIADESFYLLIHNVPKLCGVNVIEDLRILFSRYGTIDRLELVDFPQKEPFTQTYLIRYHTIAEAIRAKKSLDDYELLGSKLHISYGPELETTDEIEAKLKARQRYVEAKLAQLHNLRQLKK
uniref:RNA-binding protein 48 n=1 Tax=Sarcoptes scabiei TaxID=52283 RepID=A0A834RE66_SARSC